MMTDRSESPGVQAGAGCEPAAPSASSGAVSTLTRCKRAFGVGLSSSSWRLGLVILAMLAVALLFALL